MALLNFLYKWCVLDDSIGWLPLDYAQGGF